ncbi:uncharacterized protein BJ171DRAFT_521564 [Polychytrium aggregatum]|uniref:uncharacterized protein n=1 Tax=Polychytrium aggregatum TaxID=110093 RepID=UPI0022FE06DF|nr:uncharacterized protein BJ171DRAFT_521564 [Polychytrium aggregatum]KAI9197212.1 hypothetical protein BJ171DRAFT_521564 [Polychytrium aggregatum]
MSLTTLDEPGEVSAQPTSAIEPLPLQGVAVRTACSDAEHIDGDQPVQGASSVSAATTTESAELHPLSTFAQGFWNAVVKAQTPQVPEKRVHAVDPPASLMLGQRVGDNAGTHIAEPQAKRHRIGKEPGSQVPAGEVRGSTSRIARRSSARGLDVSDLSVCFSFSDDGSEITDRGQPDDDYVDGVAAKLAKGTARRRKRDAPTGSKPQPKRGSRAVRQLSHKGI